MKDARPDAADPQGRSSGVLGVVTVSDVSLNHEITPQIGVKIAIAVDSSRISPEARSNPGNCNSLRGYIATTF